MKHNHLRTSITGTREQINGARVLPQGFKLGYRFEKIEQAQAKCDYLNKLSEQILHGKGSTFNVSGVSGNYCILKYTDIPVIDSRYVHMT